MKIIKQAKIEGNLILNAYQTIGFPTLIDDEKTLTTIKKGMSDYAELDDSDNTFAKTDNIIAMDELGKSM